MTMISTILTLKAEKNTENSIQRVRHFFAPVQLDGSKTLRAVVKRLRDAGLLVKRLQAADGKENTFEDSCTSR